MTVPRIVIQRHKPGFYEWTILYDQERADGGTGDISIASCLASALGRVADVERLVEVQYRGLHMGTFKTNELHERTEEFSDLIAATYGALWHSS